MAVARAKGLAIGLQALGVGLVVFTLDILCLTLTRRTGAVAAIWPTDGVVLGLMASGRFKQPWTLLGAGLVGGSIAELVWGDPPMLAIGLAGANAAGVAFSFALLIKLLGDITTEKPRRMALFLVVTAIAGVGSALLGASLLHLRTGDPLGENVVIWAAADGLGYWTLGPLAQILARRSEPREPAGWARDAGVMAGFLCVLLIVFIQREYPFLFVIPLALFAVAYVSELRGVAIAILLTTAVATGLGGLGRGPIALVSGDSNKKLVVLQIFLASMTVSLLPIAVAMAERRAVFRSLGQARDIAVAEERKARNANRIVQMAEQIALVGHWHHDLADDVWVWSDQMSRLFGSQTGPSAPFLERALAAVHPHDRPALAHALSRAETDGLASTLEVRVIDQHGPRHLRVHVATERDGQGAVATVYGMALDVTQSKAAEAALTAARHDAERAAVAKAEFLADMSHEIRTPLSSILGFSHLLRGLPTLGADALRFAERITSAGESLLTAVGDILSLSRLEAGHVQIQRQSMSPAALIDEVIQMLQPQASQKGLDLQGQVEPGAPDRLLADGPRLRQVLVNLAGNAVKFTAQGRVQVSLAYDRPLSRMRIEVSDTGPGLAHHARLFERYAQPSRGAKDAADGVGLGLAISKGLVEAMGGAIGVSSVVGEGSVFWVEAPADIVPSFDAPCRVLLVDPLDINRAMMRHALSPLGLDIDQATDAHSALAAHLKQAFDVILLDVAMHENAPLALVQSFRDAAPNTGRPVILALSAPIVSDDMISQLKAAGFGGVIPKPFIPSELVAVVQQICAARPARG